MERNEYTMKTIMFSLSLLILALTLVSCTVPESNPAGAAYVDRSIPAVQKTNSIYLKEAEPVYTDSPSNASSYYLYAYNGATPDDRVQSVILFPPVVDSLALDSVKLVLHQSASNAENWAFSVTARLWNQEWQDAMDAGEVFQDELIPDHIRTWEITEDSTGAATYSIPLETERVENWQDTAGVVLMIDPAEVNVYVRFDSKQNTDDLAPRLDFYMDGDTVVTESVSPVSDTYYVRKPESLRDDLLFLDNGAHDRMRLEFDLSDIPEDVTINLAQLVLFADTLESIPDHSDYYNVNVYRLTEDYADTLAYNASYSTGTLDTGEEITVITVTTIVQGWTSSTYDNYGFLIKGFNEGLTMDRRGFYVDLEDSTRMPRLDLYVTPALASQD